MTLTIDIPAELETRIQSEAARYGISSSEFVRRALEEKLDSQRPHSKPPFEAKIIATDVPIKDRSREYAWLAANRDEYDGQYVALDGDVLIAASFDGREVVEKLHQLGINGVMLTYVEGSNHPPFISGGLW